MLSQRRIVPGVPEWTIKFIIGVEMRYDKWPGRTADDAAQGWLDNLRLIADKDGYSRLTTENGAIRIKADAIEFVEAHR